MKNIAKASRKMIRGFNSTLTTRINPKERK